MTKQTKKADKPSKAGAVKLTEERLDAASGGVGYYKISIQDVVLETQKSDPPRIR